MTDGFPPPTAPVTPRQDGRSRPPGVVVAAAVVTWVAATGTAVVTLFITLSLFLVAGELFDAFGDGTGNPGWFLAGASGLVVALSAAADVAAFLVLRGHRWSAWLLLGLSALASLGAVMLAYYVVTLAVAAAAAAVMVLLLLPETRAWLRGDDMAVGSGRRPD